MKIFGRKSKHNKEPRREMTKDELIADLKRNAEWMSKMKFTKESFFPALCKASQNIEDAKMLLTGFNNMIMQEFLAKMKEFKISDLKLEDKLDPKSPKYQENKDLLAIFSDKSVFDTKAHLEGMNGDINKNIQDENMNRQLSEMKWTWLDQI